MNKKLIVLQHGNKDCGAASLLSIIKYYNGNITLNNIVELTNTTNTGTNFYNIKNAAHQVGLNAKGFRLDNIDEIKKIKCPYMCQTNKSNNLHFIVIYKIKNNKVTIMDPSVGKVIISFEEFKNIFTGNIMIFNPYKKLPILIETNHINKQILTVLYNNKKIIINTILLSIIFIILTCITSLYFQVIIDYVINTNRLNLTVITIIFIILIIIKTTANYFKNYLITMINEKIDVTLFINMYKKIIYLPYYYFKNKATGEMISRLNDLNYIKDFISKLITTISLDSILIIITGIVLYFINKEMFIVTIVLIIFWSIITFIFKKPFKDNINSIQENYARLYSYQVESINSFETIKGINIHKYIIKRFEYLYCKMTNNFYHFKSLNNIIDYLKEIVNTIGNIIIIYVGFTQVIDNNLTIGTMITYNMLLGYFVEPFKNIIDFNIEYQYAKNSLKRANSIYEIKEEDLSKTNNLMLEGNIKIRNLSYKIMNDQYILNNVNIDIKTYEKVLIIGSSGSGKSSLLKLIMKYQDTLPNEISIGSYDILDISCKDIRENISYLSQNEILYNDTVYNNIVLDEVVDYDSFKKLTKMLYIDKIIENKWERYNYMLEENAFNLSGGERQRIILGRTLLKNRNIIMIDEGLNQIDINLERKILRNIFTEYKNKTIIIVSHRHENIDLYDKVIKIENGQVVDILIRNNGENYG